MTSIRGIVTLLIATVALMVLVLTDVAPYLTATLKWLLIICFALLLAACAGAFGRMRMKPKSKPR
jgi:hypothetical protein